MKDCRIKKLKRRLQETRFRIKSDELLDATVLDDMDYIAAVDIEHISTDGRQICFDPDWLQKLNDTELDFIIYHELVHILRGDIYRPLYYSGERFHLACDIVTNSYLSKCGWLYEKLPHLGKIHYETYCPVKEGHTLTAINAFKYIPFDPAMLKPSERRKFILDTDSLWGNKIDYREKGVLILSPDDEDPDDLLYESKFGGNYKFIPMEFNGDGGDGDRPMDGKVEDIDEDIMNNTFGNSFQGVIFKIRQIKTERSSSSDEKDYENRYWERKEDPELDWRRILDNFVQEDVYDYSFTPTDKRFADSEFLMPDFNEKLDKPMNVLFMADTSGSIDDGMLGIVYAELCSAIEQFNQGLIGYVGFFDTRVYEPLPFASVEDIEAIQPYGGGGTDFGCIFEYIKYNMMDNLPKKIIIFTDGEGPKPTENDSMGIPVLWVFDNKNAQVEWGSVARIKRKREE